MHLHSLTFQAIGPFAGRHHVDLAALGASGIYLLEGPTGAGKSTIIDAIVFALYGKVASDAASDDRLRSAFAGPDVESYVDLVLEVPAGVFRIRRTPEYRRPKKRGTGTTTQQASVRLWRLAEVPPTDAPDAVEDAAGELLSARLDEAGDEIRRLVGLDRRQLVQTVVLPQGEFATFLRAKPEDRAVLLQKVFGTELYHRAAARLAELARAARSRTDAARQGVVGAAERFAGSAGLEPDDARRLREAAHDDDRLRRADDGGAPAAAEATPGVHALAVAHVARLDAEATSLAERAAGADATLAAARERFEHERARHDALERRARLRADAARLDEEEVAVAECRRRTDAAARAAVVAPAAQGLARAEQTLRAALDRLALARTGAPAAFADADPTTLEALRADVATAAVRVARLVPVGASLPGRDRELADGRKEVAQATEERGRVLAELDARPARRDALRTRVASLAEAAGALGVLRERADRARAVEEAARQTAALATEAAEAHAERARAAVRAHEAVEHEARLRAARIAGLAGELAAGLAVGEPCPVCGGAEHPHPAPLAEDHPAVEDVERAERERAEAERLLHDVSARAQVLAERCEARRRDADGLTPQEAGQRVAHAEELVAAARTAERERAKAERELEELDAETRALEARAAGLAEAVAGTTARLQEIEAALARDRAEIRSELDAAGPLVELVDLPDPLADEGGARNPVAVLAAALEGRVRTIDALADAGSAVAAAQRACEERAADVAALVAQSGFADAAEALAAVLDDAERHALSQRVAEHDAARTATATGLADPALADLPEDVRADVAGARAAVDEAEAVAGAAARQHELVARRAEEARTAAEGVGAAVDGWTAARDAAGPVVRMAALASGTGDNAHDLSLATFVLVQRFEDVVAAANERLAEMSSGRYELVRSATREDVRAHKRGLAMKVLDHVTERERDPRTLSGGETFYVSLCLALGLADVVTAEAGGIELGTLFVDEGFGSLDPETLEAVLAALGRLRAGGRVVGVVSHVEALKQSVAERVEVRRLPGGGSTLTVRA
ncbi:AAA family ATPase [Cellulosimicrobium funkei]|uniref:Nuclease SbcCD subunit C n=1 Tax=Cellulosimicrobium funkei TaxID=264251 RepID=A0A4Y8R7E4_9MICO|nr:SMC family ATPase [Cellulosimicrobium funkei]TFF17532.1 SMC family ATPase [Cellulosimicrobium funkei]TGA73940.1 SMC family ATPase [Cellulosimicrobium terreum]